MLKKHVDILKRFYKKDRPYSNVMENGVMTSGDILVYDPFYYDQGTIIIDPKKDSGEVPSAAFDFEFDVAKKVEIPIVRSKELQQFLKNIKTFTIMYRDGYLSFVCPNENHFRAKVPLGDIEFSVNVDYFVNALAYINSREKDYIKIGTSDDYLVIEAGSSDVSMAIAFRTSHIWEGDSVCFSSFQE